MNECRKGSAIILTAAVAVCAPVSTHAQSTPDDVVGEYVARLGATMEASAGPEAVDALLDLYADHARYEHPRVGIEITSSEEIRRGMNGFLGQTRSPRIEVRSKMVGEGVAVVELEIAFDVRVEDAWRPSVRRQLSVLEIEDGRIERIIDYW